jgi:hypothetical protein
MILVRCLYIALSELSDLKASCEYKKMVSPIDYEFDLDRNTFYQIVGILTRKGTPWLYVVPVNGKKELQIVPAVLFAFNWSEIPKNWFVRITESEELEIVPKSLAKIDYWFEKYMDEEIDVIAIIEQDREAE